MSEKVRALLKFGVKAHMEMRLQDAEAAFRQAADLAQAAEDPRLHARALARLHIALGNLGRADELWDTLGATMGLYLRKLGERHAATIMLQSCMLRYISPEHENAELLLQGVVSAATLPEHRDDLDVARSLGLVAFVCNAMGKADLGKRLLETAIPVFEAQLGAQNHELALLLYNLANLRGEREGFDKVEPLIRRALAIQEAVLVPGHLEKVAPLMTLGAAQSRRGKYAEAQSLLDRALTISLAVEGRDGQTPAMVRAALAQLRDRMSVDPAAEPVLVQAVAAAEQDAVAGPFGAAEQLTLLCRHFFLRGKPKAAEPHYRRLVALAEKLRDLERGILRATMGIPGGVYTMLQQDQADLAEKLLLGELATMEIVLAAGHQDRLNQIYFTGNVYRMTGQHKKALAMFERQLAESRARADTGDAYLADVLGRVLDAQLELGKKKEAERTADEIESLTDKRPYLDPALNQIRRELGTVWQGLGELDAPELVDAAHDDDGLACFVLGLCFEGGIWARADPKRALAWYERGGLANHSDSRVRWEALRKRIALAPAEQSMVVEALSRWIKQPR